MAGQFKLLVGVHQGRDASGTKDPDTGLYPLRTYRTGETVVSEQDLVYLFGKEKFAYADAGAGRPPSPGEPSEHMRNVSPAVAPHGQVITGHQQTSGGPGGTTVSGPIDPAKAERLGVAAAGTQEAATASRESKSTRAEDYAVAGAGANEPDYESMTVAELRDHAAAEEINLHGAATKAEIVRAIKKGK
jgi:hypothetical protein